MRCSAQIVPVPKPFKSVVVRPRSVCCGSSSGPEVLLFMDGETCELLQAPSSDGKQGFSLSAWCIKLPDLSDEAIYEPKCDSIVFSVSGTAVMRLDRANRISLVAGSEEDGGLVDGRGEAARFNQIMAMTADGKGHIYVADANRIRVVDVSTGEVATVPGSEPQGTRHWNVISYDAAADVLVAATASAICHIALPGSQQAAAAASPRLVAGDWSETGMTDGRGAEARLYVLSIIAGAGGRLYFIQPGELRTMDATGAVSTLCILVDKTLDKTFNSRCNMAFLPGGELVISHLVYHDDEDAPGITIVSGGNFAPSGEALAGRLPSPVRAITQLPNLLLMPTDVDGSGASTVVTIRVGGGKAFVAHRSALAARSDYFRRHLASDGGFSDSGSAEVSLLDADPDAFGAVLGYLYTGEVHVPDELLRPAVELAEQLLLPADCSARMQAQLRAATSPATVVSDLCWAESRGMKELVSYLKSYMLWHRREVAKQGGLAGLSRQCPELADELMQALLGA